MNIFNGLSNEEILKKTREMDPPKEEIPDIEQLMDMVIEFMTYISTDQMQTMEKSDPDGFEKHLDNKFSAFSLRYYGIFKMLLEKKGREENLAKLIDLFSSLNKVKTGKKSMDLAYEQYTEGLNNEYIYPKYGGKEKFEQHIKNKNKKNN